MELLSGFNFFTAFHSGLPYKVTNPSSDNLCNMSILDHRVREVTGGSIGDGMMTRKCEKVMLPVPSLVVLILENGMGASLFGSMGVFCSG